MRTPAGGPLSPTSPLDALRAEDVMTRNPVSLRHSVTVREAAQYLIQRQLRAAPVIDDAGRPVGVLSRTDLIRASAFGLEDAPVTQVATPSVICVDPEAAASRVAELMVVRGVRRVFVVDGSGTLVGVVGTSDLLGAVCGGGVELPAEARRRRVASWEPGRN